MTNIQNLSENQKDNHEKNEDISVNPFIKPNRLNQEEIKKIASKYKRIGTNYYLFTKTLTAKKEPVTILKKWSKTTIKDDHGTKVLEEIEKFYDFALVPDNTEGYSRNMNGCFNMYEPILHKPIKGNFPMTEFFLKHIFGEYYDVGLDYLTILYNKPVEKLPALCLVSKIQKTGKSTFLKWLNRIYGDNATILGNEDFASNFNSPWASKLIIGIDESFIEKRIIKEKIKRLVTDDFILSESKGIDKVRRNFIGKFILLSNNEDNFIQMEKEDSRFFVLKIPAVKDENPNIDKTLYDEIPAFLYFLKNRRIQHEKKSRLWFNPETYETDALRAVVKNSKTVVEKEMVSVLSELMDYVLTDENGSDFDKDCIKITPKRLEDKLKENIKYSSGLHLRIRDILLEWGLSPTTKTERYKYPYLDTDNFKGTIIRTIRPRIEIGKYYTIPFSLISQLNDE